MSRDPIPPGGDPGEGVGRPSPADGAGLARRPRAVLFDAGETLLLLDRAAIARACGGAVTLEQLEAALLDTRRAIDALVLPHLDAGRPVGQERAQRGRPVEQLLLERLALPPERARAAIAELVALHDALRLWTVVPADALPTLDALAARGLRLAVVSNSEGRVAEKLDLEGFRGRFELVVDSHHEGVSKPDPEIFRRALARLDLPAEDALYVGDLWSVDALAALRVGMQAVVVDRHGGYTVPCPRIRALAALPGLIDAAPA